MYYTFSAKLRGSSWSSGTVLCVQHLFCKVARFELELRKRTSPTTLFLQSCEVRAGAAEAYFAYYTFSAKLRASSWSCGSVLRVQHFFCKVARFELELRKRTSRTTLFLQSCGIRAGAAEVYFAYYTLSAKLRGSSWSSGSVLCVLHSFARLDLEQRELYFAYNTFSAKLRGSSWSSGSILRVLHFFCKVARFELEVRKRSSRTKLFLQSCEVRAELRKRTSRTTLFLQSLLRDSSWSCGSVLRVLHFICKVARFEVELRKRTSRTTLHLQSCEIPAGAAEAYFAYYTLSAKLRDSSWSCGSVLRVLDFIVARFELELRKRT